MQRTLISTSWKLGETCREEHIWNLCWLKKHHFLVALWKISLIENSFIKRLQNSMIKLSWNVE
jgi:hypothetical protein